VISIAFGVALVGMAGVSGLVILTVGFAAIRWLGAGALDLLSTTAVAVWTDQRRGTAIGLATAAVRPRCRSTSASPGWAGCEV